MSAAPDEFLPTRHSLLSRLRNWEDQESWREFFETYWKLIYGVAIRAGLSEAEAQDVVQETVLSVAKKMPGFRYDPAVGSFKSWLLLITRRRIADHLRKRSRQPAVAEPLPGEEAETSLVERMPDPAGPDLESVWDEEWNKAILGAALQRIRRQVDAKQFQIFDSYVLKEWPVEVVSQTLGVSAAQVYLAKHRISALLKKEIERQESKGL